MKKSKTRTINNKKYRILWNRVILAIILLIVIIILSIFGIINLINIFTTEQNGYILVENNLEDNYEEIEKETLLDDDRTTDIQTTNDKEVETEIKETIKEQYRLTSFYSNDELNTGSCTGTGLCENDFQINDKGWYTYNGKLVLASATYECLNSKSGACGNWNEPIEDKTYYNYYDIIYITIDDITYEGIILDSCGASMFITYENRIDLFVSNKQSAIDRGYKGNNTVQVWNEK